MLGPDALSLRLIPVNAPGLSYAHSYSTIIGSTRRIFAMAVKVAINGFGRIGAWCCAR